MAAAVTTDEIYKRYLDKAIKEIHRLEHEVAAAAEGDPVAQPTGHPLAHDLPAQVRPAAAGARRRASRSTAAPGHALKRRSSGSHVDPSEVFGTNCVKFAGADLETSRGLAARASCGSSSRSSSS